MKKIQKLALSLMIVLAFQVSAQETDDTQQINENTAIENFQLPTFTELSSNIATEYSEVRERLPELSTIGEYVHKGLRRGVLSDHNISAAFRNLTTEHSILPDITPKRFQLRTSLNNIMFNGYDINQLHCGGAWRGGQ
ncbi:MAG: hypothetical protein AAF611_11575 [Bacteroidota bacterium]